MAETAGNDHWDIHITAGKGYLSLNLKEIWRYRDLLMMFVKKDIITVYKQTILGPLWFFIQPILTSLMFLVVFSGIANISTGGIPPILFYMAGTTLWNYFSDTLNVTSKTFTDNASIFGKVYFPRMVLPLSKVLSGFIKFLIQFGLFLVVWLYYLGVGLAARSIWPTAPLSIEPNMYILLTPIWLLIIVLISLGFGIIITSLTTKYRDLMFLISFGVQLAMYVTPVIYPLSSIADGSRKKMLILLNPLTSLFEAVKYGFFGKPAGTFNVAWLEYSAVFCVVLLAIGVVIFNRVEKRFIDTV